MLNNVYHLVSYPNAANPEGSNTLEWWHDTIFV